MSSSGREQNHPCEDNRRIHTEPHNSLGSNYQSVFVLIKIRCVPFVVLRTLHVIVFWTLPSSFCLSCSVLVLSVNFCTASSLSYPHCALNATVKKKKYMERGKRLSPDTSHGKRLFVFAKGGLKCFRKQMHHGNERKTWDCGSWLCICGE